MAAFTCQQKWTLTRRVQNFGRRWGLKIEVKHIKPVTNQGNLRAYVAVQIDEVTVHDCRLIQQPGQSAFLLGPQKRDGGRWRPVVTMAPGLRQEVQAAVLAAWQKQEVGRA
jgi:DNA-binding cell septation regulator SpoVG